FIDEGFGSLDLDTLDVVIDTLDTLQESGRQVGVISHVPGLAERLGIQVRVEPMAAGLSEVRIVTPR
ncbi:MAG: nuclease SbcCD subunit C, partial [Myxococcales bacterium]|nr:nuclease SbcCD subunit C [Myxococcales bacterium]